MNIKTFLLTRGWRKVNKTVKDFGSLAISAGDLEEKTIWVCGLGRVSEKSRSLPSESISYLTFNV